MGQAFLTFIDVWLASPTRYSKGQILPTCRSKGRSSLSWSSTSKLPRRWGWRFRNPYSYAPTRSSNDCGDEAARVHHAYRRRGGVAAGGACAAAGEGAYHRVSWNDHGVGLGAMDCRFCAAAARTRLDRGSQPRDRVSLGRWTHRPVRRDRG